MLAQSGDVCYVLRSSCLRFYSILFFHVCYVLRTSYLRYISSGYCFEIINEALERILVLVHMMESCQYGLFLKPAT